MHILSPTMSVISLKRNLSVCDLQNTQGHNFSTYYLTWTDLWLTHYVCWICTPCLLDLAVCDLHTHSHNFCVNHLSWTDLWLTHYACWTSTQCLRWRESCQHGSPGRSLAPTLHTVCRSRRPWRILSVQGVCCAATQWTPGQGMVWRSTPTCAAYPVHPPGALTAWRQVWHTSPVIIKRQTHRVWRQVWHTFFLL